MAYIKMHEYNPNRWTEYTLDQTPREFFMDGIGGYIGYLVTVRTVDKGRTWSRYQMPVFTHDQMLECQELQNELADKYDDAFDRLEYSTSENIWVDTYCGEPIDYIEQLTIDGITVYPLGERTGWPWDWQD